MNISAKRLFLIDGLGALVSAFFLGVLLIHFHDHIGMPKQTLYFLSLFPCIFALYDLRCYFRIRDNWRVHLRIIATANLLYCVLSIILLIYHFQILTLLGISYFLIEIIILAILIFIEFRTATIVD